MGSEQRRIQWVPDNFAGVNQPEREIGHSSLVPDLRMSGSILLFFLYVFMLWTGTALSFPFIPAFRHLVKKQQINLVTL